MVHKIFKVSMSSLNYSREKASYQRFYSRLNSPVFNESEASALTPFKDLFFEDRVLLASTELVREKKPYSDTASTMTTSRINKRRSHLRAQCLQHRFKRKRRTHSLFALLPPLSVQLARRLVLVD